MTRDDLAPEQRQLQPGSKVRLIKNPVDSEGYPLDGYEVGESTICRTGLDKGLVCASLDNARDVWLHNLWPAGEDE